MGHYKRLKGTLQFPPYGRHPRITGIKRFASKIARQFSRSPKFLSFASELLLIPKLYAIEN